jgi:hypothetical protein
LWAIGAEAISSALQMILHGGRNERGLPDWIARQPQL